LKAKNVRFKAKNVRFKAKYVANIFDKFFKNFALPKLPIGFNGFDNFGTGRVSYFTKHETTELSPFCRALVLTPYLQRNVLE